MPEYRRDPLSGRRVIIAPERARRPIQISDESSETEVASDCPFCAGHESATPPAIALFGESSLSGVPALDATDHDWHVRVVPNLYPALTPFEQFAEASQTPRERIDLGPSPTKRPNDDPHDSRLYDREPGVGAHEVIIETPRHLSQVAQIGSNGWRIVVAAYAARLAALRSSGRYAHALLFKNVGARAGASLAHTHSQLMAFPHLAPNISDECNALASARRLGQPCNYCDVAARELNGPREIAQSANFVAFCPFASRFAGECWIVPREHQKDFDVQSPRVLAELGDLMFDVLWRVEHVIKPLAYNMVLHTAPFEMAGPEFFHWHIEILPRQAHLAGLELGGGFFVNSWPPEEAAARYRDVR